MTSAIERPGSQELFERYKSMFETVVLGGAQVVPESNEWYAVAFQYAAGEQAFALASQYFAETDPATACFENLVRIAAADGIYPRADTFAQGYVKLTGTAGAEFPSRLQITAGEQTFITATDTGQPTQIGADGAAVVRVRALQGGSVGNQIVTTGTIAGGLTNVDQTVEVCGGSFCAGQDAETEAEFRARYIARLQYKPRATDALIRELLGDWPCVTRVYQRGGSCCRCSDCNDIGTDCQDCGCAECNAKLDYYVLFDGSFDCGIPPESVVEELQTWLFGELPGYGQGQLPVGVCGTIREINPVLVNVGVDVATCLSSAQRIEIETQVAEYFETIAPSEPVSVPSVQAIVLDILGIGQTVNVYLTLQDEALGYGDLAAQDDTRHVFVTAGGLEPDCDYMLCLGGISVTAAGQTVGNCA